MTNPDDPKHPGRDAETVALFIEESLESLQRVEQMLLDAERGIQPPDMLSGLFRDLHTIKGTSSFLRYNNIPTLSHLAEDLLARLRDKKLRSKPEHWACLLKVADALRQMIANVKATGNEGDVSVSSLVEDLKVALRDDEEEPVAPPPPVVPKVPVHDSPPAPPPAPLPAAPPPAPHVAVRRAGATLAPRGSMSPKPLLQMKQDGGDSTVRVNVAVLDRLMNLIGELVLARNQTIQLAKTWSEGNAASQATLQRLNLVTSDIQEQIMKTRMLPISRVFEKIPRMVRDLSRAVGKQVTTQIDGTTTEIDKTLVEAIRDPIMHIVRNAIDHGLETAEERLEAGKPAMGTVSVRATHQGGMVTIDIRDDGRGMDPKKLRAHAVNRQVLGAAEAARLSDREALNLVFRPGFSTAEKVTDISGRGVGMDVVRTHIERAGGQVEIESVVGKGTAIHLKMPLTLAIIPALLVVTAGQRFAIPQVNLLELVYLNEEQSKTALEYVRGAAVYRLRGEVLPIVRLSDVLQVESAGQREIADTNIVVLAVGSRRYGLIVDAIRDTEEIVIKPLHGQLKRITCYSGATVLGDGGVALILDAAGVAAKAGIDLSTHARDDTAGRADAVQGRQSLVIFHAGGGAQCAVPLSMVARLERISASSIESVGGTEVVQYRDAIMPIIRPESLVPLGVRPAFMSDDGEPEDQPLIVFDFGQMVGMAVNAIVDVVDVVTDSTSESGDIPYTIGKLVIFERTTLLIDVYSVVRQLAPQFVKDRRTTQRSMRVLLADDSNAMRAALGGYLRSCGLEVVEVGSGEAALREIRSPKAGHFDALVTDLEMPGTSGFDVIETMRHERPTLPVFAWTFHEDPTVADRAIGLGARACIHKLRREDLMAALQNHGIGLKRREDRRQA